MAEINEVEDKLDLYEKEINNVNYALLNRTLNQEYIEKQEEIYWFAMNMKPSVTISEELGIPLKNYRNITS